MSAIAGLWRFDGRPDAGEACGRMLDALAPYGRDAVARWDGGDIAMGRRLRRTLPEDVFDRQPLSGGGGSLRLVADLRLDNREDLALELGLAAGHTSTLSDADLLLAAWERWEEGVFGRLVGEYAFALFDERRRRLILARDPLGHRPLFHHRGPGFFAFSTMAKGLHALPEVPYAPDEERVAEFLILMPTAGDRSFFKDVRRVMPATWLEVTPDGMREHRHWNPSRGTLRLAGDAAYVEALRRHLDQATVAQLRGAGDAVASHLSGGFDSAAVTATAARVMAPSGGRVVAYTAVPRPGYDLPAPRGRFGDEGPLAAATAALHPNIEHVRIASGGASPLAGLDRAFFLTEQPLLNPCNTVWDSAIREAARSRGLSVLLTGQMGNVTLSWSGIDLLPQLLSRGRLLRWSREAWGLVRRGGFGPGGVLAQSFGPWTPGWLWSGLHKAFGRGGRDTHSYSAIDPSRLPALAAQARERHLDLFPRPRKDGFEARMWVLGRADHGAHHKGALAAFGVDARDPTADRRLIEFCLSVPAEQWLRDGFARRLGRLALADRLPAQVLNQRGKGLQAIDWHEGATAALADIRDEVERQAGNGAASRALDVTRMRGLAADWPTGGWDSNDVMRTYRLAFLRGLAVGHFLRRASGGNA